LVVKEKSQVWQASTKASKSVCTWTVVVSPDPFSPTSSTSTVIYTCDPQIYGPSASLVETEKTAQKIEMNPDVHVTADERNT
jgi:hypothetical protein